MKSLSLLGALLFFFSTSQAQNIAIKPSGSTTSSAILDLGATQTVGSEKGFLMTRMDSTSRSLIAAPANSLWLYQNKEDSGFYYYNVDEWRRAHQTYGTVQMDNLSSLRLNGSHTFTVEHLAPGIDDVTYRDFIGAQNSLGIPHVVVSGENTEAPLQLHGNVADYCVLNQTNSNNAYVNTVIISNGATNLVTNTVTGASPSTYYAHTLLDNSINDCVAQGNTLNFTVQPIKSGALSGYLQVWVDWDADGIFTVAETEYSTSFTTPAPINFAVTVPAIPVAAQAQFTAVRVMSRNFSSFDTDGCLVGAGGSNHAEVEDYYIPLCSATGTYPILAPFCSINSSGNQKFRVHCQDINGEPINVKYHFKVHEK